MINIGNSPSSPSSMGIDNPAAQTLHHEDSNATRLDAFESQMTNAFSSLTSINDNISRFLSRTETPYIGNAQGLSQGSINSNDIQNSYHSGTNTPPPHHQQ